MERKKYLELCQRCAVLSESVLGIKRNVPKELCVVYDGITYYPVSYRLSFDRAGNAVHSAVLHDLFVSSTLEAELGRVDEKEVQKCVNVKDAEKKLNIR